MLVCIFELEALQNMNLHFLNTRECTILYFRIPHNTLCLPPNFHKLLFSNAPVGTACSLEHVKTITYANSGGGRGGGANRVYYGRFENSQCKKLKVRAPKI